MQSPLKQPLIQEITSKLQTERQWKYHNPTSTGCKTVAFDAFTDQKPKNERIGLQHGYLQNFHSTQ